jgi:hypothetical protein
MCSWGSAPDFSLHPGPDTDQPLDEESSLEDALRDHTGQPLDWTRANLHRMSQETTFQMRTCVPSSAPAGGSTSTASAGSATSNRTYRKEAAMGANRLPHLFWRMAPLIPVLPYGVAPWLRLTRFNSIILCATCTGMEI